MESFEVLPAHADMLEPMDSEFSLLPEPQQWTHSSLHSAIMQDANGEEIQKLVLELIEDNRLLRESLRSSSATMKSQLTSIISWCSTMAQRQAEESQTQDTESIKLQLKEALTKIDYLKQEIGEQYLKIKSICEENEKEKNILKSKLATQEELNSKSEESQAEKFQEKMNILKLENVKAINQLVDEVRTLKEKLSLEQKAHAVERLKHQEDKKLLSVIQSNYDKVAKQLQMQTRSWEQKPGRESKESQEQVDLLTARLFDCEQRLEQSEAKGGMLNLANEAQVQVEAAAARHSKEEKVKTLAAHLSDCRQRLGASKEQVNRLVAQLEIIKGELQHHRKTSKLAKSLQKDVDLLTARLSGSRQQVAAHQVEVNQLADKLKLAKKELASCSTGN